MGDSNKGLVLFDYLATLEGRKLNLADLQVTLYKKPNRDALKRLANRTRKKVLESMSLEVNVSRAGAYPKKIVFNIDVRKELSQAQMLHRRGERGEARKMLERAATSCKKYELYEELSMTLRMLMKSRSLEDGDKDLADLMKRYRESESAKDALLRAEIFHAKVVAKNDFNSSGNTDQANLQLMLEQMQDDFQKTDSAQIGSYYYLLEAQKYQWLRQYKMARNSLTNNFKLVMQYPAIRTDDNIAAALLNLADNDLYIGNFERTFNQAEKTLTYCKKNNHNYEAAVELMFYAKYFKGEYLTAQNLLLQLIPSEKKSKNFRDGKRSYLLAATQFMLQDFQSAMTYLHQTNPITEDKQDWNTGIKILQIMTAIELEDAEGATLKIDSLRKYFENGNAEKNHRAKLINTLLAALTYNGFKFKAVFQEMNSMLNMLAEKSGALAWEIKTSEMVVFHSWFKAKAANQHTFKQEIPSFNIDSEFIRLDQQHASENHKKENEDGDNTPSSHETNSEEEM